MPPPNQRREHHLMQGHSAVTKLTYLVKVAEERAEAMWVLGSRSGAHRLSLPAWWVTSWACPSALTQPHPHA